MFPVACRMLSRSRQEPLTPVLSSAMAPSPAGVRCRVVRCGPWVVSTLRGLSAVSSLSILRAPHFWHAGSNSYGESTVPSGLSDVVQVTAALSKTCALKSACTVTCWGAYVTLCCTEPFGMRAYACSMHAAQQRQSCCLPVVLVLTPGRVGAGDNQGGQTTVPSGLTNVIQVAAGEYYVCALKRDGSVACCGALSQRLLWPQGDLGLAVHRMENVKETGHQAGGRAAHRLPFGDARRHLP